jgi:hypothetical protein
MRRHLLSALILGGATWANSAHAQTPDIRNGRVETRQAASLDSAMAAVSGDAGAVWIGWLVPKVTSDHQLCTPWAPALSELGATPLEPESMPAQSRQPVRLEGGTSLVLLIRVTGRTIDRIRTLDDECPIDAGGRAVHWLTGITAAESLRFLDALVQSSGATAEGTRRVASAAVAAIALHGDAAADAVLDRLMAPGAPDALVRHAAAWIGSARGAHGFETLRTRIGTATDAGLRRSFVSALGRTRQPQTAAVLLALARTDADAGVRSEAVHWYAARTVAGGAPVDLLDIIEQDRDDAVRRRAISSLGQLAANDGVPALIQLAETGDTPLIRKEAVRTLGRLTDTRARVFLERVIAR